MNDTGILITGSTGRLGSEIIRTLLKRDVCVRIAARDREKAEINNTSNCDIVHFDFEKTSTYDNALRGIRSLFLATPVTHPGLDELLMPFIVRAREVGVQHIVSLGSIGLNLDTGSPMMVIEKCIQNCGIHYTILRLNLLMQNLIRIIGPSIRARNSIFVPASGARISFVDERDVAQAAAAALLSDSHSEKLYSLTGPESLTFYQLASILSAVTGRNIHYSPVSHNEFFENLIDNGCDFESAEFMVGLFEIARHGWCEDVKPDLEAILGRSPCTFTKFAQDYREEWG